SIDPIDERDWTDIVRSIADPWNAALHLYVEIGPGGSDGSELFGLWVATSSCKHKALDDKGVFRGVLVELLDVQTVKATLEAVIESIEADTWEQVVVKLRQITDYWEYDGMQTIVPE
ncbi:MAG: Imm8 family immunity protein, partial [Phycisphaeraceae bacterium JB051]